MSKLKLLYIARSNQYRVSQGNYYFQKELEKITDLTVWRESGNIHDILAKLTTVPDFILIKYGKKGPFITGLGTLSIPSGLYLEDLQYQQARIRKTILRNKIDYIFSVYRDKFYKWYPNFKNKMRWLPHHVNTNVCKDYGLPKETDYLLIGNVSPTVYPLRKKILETMQNKSNFVHYKHPGYGEFEQEKLNEMMTGEKYAMEINQAKIFFTCHSTLKYPVRKYFEVLAGNTLLLAPASKELSDLGFVPGEHYVEINKQNFLEKAEYYLKNEEERKKIAEQGYRMVHENHSTAIRAKQLVAMIKDMIESYHSPKVKLQNKEKRKGSLLLRKLRKTSGKSQ